MYEMDRGYPLFTKFITIYLAFNVYKEELFFFIILFYFTLFYLGSVASSIVSRKSSSRSIRSTTTVTSKNSEVRKNSGAFDGNNTRKSRHSTDSRKSSSTSQREQVIAEYYKELQFLEELQSEESSSEEEDEAIITLNEVSNQMKVEEYVMKHSNIDHEMGGDKAFIAETNNQNNNIHENRRPLTRIASTKLHLRDINSLLRRNQRYTTVNIEEKTSSHRKIKDSAVCDINSNNMGKTFDIAPKRTKIRTEMSLEMYNEKRYGSYRRVTKKESFQFSDMTASDTSSSDSSTHGSNYSISTASSNSNRLLSPRHSVPMNFIPGRTYPVVKSSNRPRNKSLPVPLSNIKTVTFCFKGITCQLSQNTPRTYKAFAHAGCVGLLAAAPSSHKCKH